MSNSTTYDIKKIIEQEKLLKAGATNRMVPEQEIKKLDSVIIDQKNEEVLLVEKQTRKAGTKNNLQKKEVKESEIFERIKEFGNMGGESYMLHLSLNEKVYHLTKQLSAAKKITVTKLLGFAMLELLKNNPELEEAIKKHIKTLEL